MSREIQWVDRDTETGERRFVVAEKFAKQWRFKVRHKRRENWSRSRPVTRAMWEELLDALERRVQRAEGITEVDVAYAKAMIAAMPDEPAA